MGKMPKSELNPTAFELRIRTQIIAVVAVLTLVSTCVWVWRTVAMRAEFARVIAKSVDRELQVGDLRGSMMNVERAGQELFEKIHYVDYRSVLQFTMDGKSKSLFPYHVRVPVKNPESDRELSSLEFWFNPFEGLFYFLIILVPALSALGFLEYKRSLKRLRSEMHHFGLAKSAEAKEFLATQVAHDIRSPLSALNMVVGTLKELPEEKRHLIRNAAQRINDIANGLLQKPKSSDASFKSTNPSAEPVMLALLIDAVMSEKRFQFREDMQIEISADLASGYGVFADVNSSDFARVLSNIINNAVEATNGKGRVTVALRAEAKHAIVEIRDNGTGIPAELVKKLGERGFTHGKAGTESGSGLGLYHAKEIINAASGQLEFESAFGIGTFVRITLPRVSVPKWFVDRIQVSEGATIVIVGDDQTVHQIWSDRLASLEVGQKVDHKSFASLNQLTSWLSSGEKGAAVFLIDYEFVGLSENGLDRIAAAGIAKQSILVTSRSESPEVRTRAGELGIKILPKAQAALVPIDIVPKPVRLDALVIDDDSLIKSVWEMAAAKQGKKIACFESLNEFLIIAPTLDRETPILIDVNLADGVRGEDVAVAILRLGFSNISLATGYEAETIKIPPGVRRVVGKDPLFH